MNTLTRNRAAERFARLIDVNDPPAYLDGGEASMRPAVALTAALRSVAHTTSPAPLSPDARLAMRERLVAAANAPAEASLLSPGVASRASDTASRASDTASRAKDTASRAAGSARRLGRRTSALVGSFAIVTSFAGVGIASAHSLPGDPFYSVKKATESVQLWLATGTAAKGERHLEFARTRLAEIRKLGVDSPYVASTLKSMDSETRQGTSDLIQAYRSSGSKEPLADLVSFSRKQYAAVARLGESLPDRLRGQALYSMTLLVGVAQDVQSVTGTTCLTCLVTGHKPPKQSSPTTTTPSPAPSASEPATPSSTGPSKSGPSSPPSTPTHLLPTNLLPTGLLPTLPPLLGTQKGKAAPKITPLPLISNLTHLLTGR